MRIVEIMEDALQQKEEGNRHFKDGRYGDAVACYTKALSLNSKGGTDTSTYLKNRAASYLKLEKYSDAAHDCSAVLDMTPNDPKALFRRCQALEALEKHEEAYRDATLLMRTDPQNKAIQPILRRLNPIIQNKVKQHHSTDNKVSQMFDLAFNNSETDIEKRKQAISNLIVLARESAGAEKIFENDGVKKINFLLDTEGDKIIRLTAIRVLACLAQNSKKRAIVVFGETTLKKISALISVDDDEISTASAHLLQNILLSISDLDRFKTEREIHEKQRKADIGSRIRPFPFLSEKIDKDANQFIDMVFMGLTSILNSFKASACGRDNAIELLVKFISRKDGFGWPKQFIETGGLANLLEVGGSIPEHKIMPVTRNTRMHASLLMSKVWDDLRSDEERDLYREVVDAYFTDVFSDNLMDSKVEAVMALSALLQGPMEVGARILGREGILELILAMADSENITQTKYAVEALVFSASKKERCAGVIKQATPILKHLYQNSNDTIKVRALVGLCKLGSFGGQDTSAKTFAEGSTQTLAKACRKFLSNPAKDVDLRKWAAEGLAYLALDADVKEELVDDTDAVIALIELAKVPDQGTIYPVTQVFVQVTNSYDVKKPEAEMMELAKFAQQHIPEDHEKDGEQFVSARIDKLVKAGLVNALVALSKTESNNSRELLARVFLAVCTPQEHRGLVVQQGGAKVLLPLALTNSDDGKFKAAQALAKVAITTNPEIAFPGERSCEVVRPILMLLEIDRSSIENFEGLMALTNLASTNDTIRSRIIKEKGFDMIEHYCFEDHMQLKRAAVECMCNLVLCEEVIPKFQGANERVKLLLLYCGEVDEEEGLVRAAAGALAVLTSFLDPEICGKVTTCSTQWVEILSLLAAHMTPDIQYRGIYILRNLLSVEHEEIPQRVVGSKLLEVLMAVSKISEPERKMSKDCADGALEMAVERKLIQPAAEQVADS